MADKNRSARDAFGFSLKGLRAAAYYTAVMAVADDGINAAWDERLGKKRDIPDEPVAKVGRTYGRFWLSRHQRVT
jgi:hypothetical protein